MYAFSNYEVLLRQPPFTQKWLIPFSMKLTLYGNICFVCFLKITHPLFVSRGESMTNSVVLKNIVKIIKRNRRFVRTKSFADYFRACLKHTWFQFRFLITVFPIFIGKLKTISACNWHVYSDCLLFFWVNLYTYLSYSYKFLFLAWIPKSIRLYISGFRLPLYFSSLFLNNWEHPLVC